MGQKFQAKLRDGTFARLADAEGLRVLVQAEQSLLHFLERLPGPLGEAVPRFLLGVLRRGSGREQRTGIPFRHPLTEPLEVGVVAAQAPEQPLPLGLQPRADNIDVRTHRIGRTAAVRIHL